MKIDIGLTTQELKLSTTILEHILADAFVLYTKTLNFHWNVVGFHFASLHKLFEGQYEELAEHMDRVAERLRALGAPAPGTLKEFLALTSLKETPKAKDEKEMLKLLLLDHEKVISHIRKELTKLDADHGTINMLEDLIEGHEKTAWMLRSHL
jgi:starvation-inducible DNA-binding protein